MARVSTINLNWARDGLDERIMMFRKTAPKIYEKMVRIEKNKEPFVRIASMGDFSPADTVNEATGIIYDDVKMPFQMDVYKIKKGLGFALSSETIDRDRYGAFKKPGILMARAIEKAKEADIANLMNLATTGSLVTPDQVAIASTAHLMDNGFFSNILSSNAPLSASSLEQACNEIAVQPSYEGDPMQFMGPFDLWVAPQLRGLAHRLVHTRNGGLAETNNNDKNWGGDQVRRIVANPYFLNPNAWALVVLEEEFEPFKMFEERKLKLANQYDMDKDVEKFGATAIWCKAAVNAAGFIYSAGQ